MPPVDGSEIRRSPVEVGSLSHYLEGLVYLRCRSSAINCTVCQSHGPSNLLRPQPEIAGLIKTEWLLAESLFLNKAGYEQKPLVSGGGTPPEN